MANTLDDEAVVDQLVAERVEVRAEDAAEARRRMVFIGLGIMLVVLCYPDSGIGKLPLRYMLKDHLHLGPKDLASFFVLANIPSLCKPLIALFSDSIPLFGTRRRNYLILAGSIGLALWGVMAFVPHEYKALLTVAIALNAMATVGGTINGAVVVEEGQRQGETGKTASLRSVCSHTILLVGGPLGGWLAMRPFGWTCAVGGALMGGLVVLAITCLHEPPTAERDTQAWRRAWEQVKTLGRSWMLWVAGGLVFLITVAPGFSTPLFYYQTDKLRFSPEFIGLLSGISSAVSIGAGVVYYFLCRRFRLRQVIVLCITLNVLSALAYVLYRGEMQAVLIDGFYGMGAVLGFLCLFDLTARATPKGSEAMGYSILYAFINLASNASDYVGSFVFELFHRHFTPMVIINAGTTAVVLLAIPFLPAALVNRRDGEKEAA